MKFSVSCRLCHITEEIEEILNEKLHFLCSEHYNTIMPVFMNLAFPQLGLDVWLVNPFTAHTHAHLTITVYTTKSFIVTFFFTEHFLVLLK